MQPRTWQWMKEKEELAEQGLQRCTNCKEVQPIEKFYQRDTKNKISWCKTCMCVNASKYRVERNGESLSPCDEAILKFLEGKKRSYSMDEISAGVYYKKGYVHHCLLHLREHGYVEYDEQGGVLVYRIKA